MIKEPLKKQECTVDKKTSIDSPLKRKVALLFLIAIFSFYNYSIMQMGEKISQTPPSPPKEVVLPSPLEKNVRQMVTGYPMEKMIPYISKREEKVAAFLVSIAKKESNWGRRSPKLDVKDCYNYWGYRARSEKVTWDGYTCFESPRHAIQVVGKRIETLVNDSQLDTPEKMIVWKCGWDCSWDNPYAVKKWIKDVDHYYKKIVKKV
jgi:hypothetical protein